MWDVPSWELALCHVETWGPGSTIPQGVTVICIKLVEKEKSADMTTSLNLWPGCEHTASAHILLERISLRVTHMCEEGLDNGGPE